MEFVAIVAAAALLQFFMLGIRVGQARGKYGVEAPATTGHPIFERHYRVQQNTLEQLVIFLPSVWMFAAFVSPRLAGVLGIAFIVGRVVYERGYVADPKQRGTGFAITAGANGILLLGGLLGALWNIL